MSLANNTNELNIIGSHIAHMKEEYGTQSGLIAQIKTVLQQKASGEVPPSKLAGYIDGSLTEVTASDLEGATKIRDYAFYNAQIISVELPNSIISIGQNTFSSCTMLKSLTIPDGVTSLGNNTLSYCSKLTSLKLSDNLTSLGYYCLNGCTSLTTLTIPATVKSCGNASLQIGSSTNKATITFLGTTPPSISSDTFDKNKLNQIRVPKDYGDTYKSKTNWAKFADLIVESET